MKKLLAILLALSMLLLCACSAPDSSGSSFPSGGDNPDSSYSDSVSQTESVETLEGSSAAEEGPENSTGTTSMSDRDDKIQEENDPGVKPGSNQSQETTGKDNPKETLPSQSSGDNNSSESSKPTETTKPTKTTKPTETTKPQETTKPTETTKPSEETKPQTDPTESKPTATVPEQEETNPTEESKPNSEFDINYWIEYAKNYAVSKGLVLSSAAVDCWDNPIGAGTHCIYLERDIQSRLNRYANDEDITDVWIWAESTGNGRYDLYIGYA